ncbi:hypothetical protein K9B33_02550 [Sphingobium sp. 3R8]|uniref:hypothetical protein n=1 Tax=Sphingobium sp. 3R8 TaxID=2874921 RepID=UPI001CCFA5C2|nr:hypothetical protein [Sphingobium sp. 3R8]MBZ9646413.1 hypothetical protein [Sphingobium sp. 3R8]
MHPWDINEILRRDEFDDLIDELSSSTIEAFNPFTKPAIVTMTIGNADFAQSIMDLAIDAMHQSKREYVSAINGERSSEASTAADKVVAMREILRQLVPIRNGES